MAKSTSTRSTREDVAWCDKRGRGTPDAALVDKRALYEKYLEKTGLNLVGQSRVTSAPANRRSEIRRSRSVKSERMLPVRNTYTGVWRTFVLRLLQVLLLYVYVVVMRQTGFSYDRVNRGS